MSHKKNDLSYSEGRGSNSNYVIDRQVSNSSLSSNPWGVQLNKLSFKKQPIASNNASSKNPYGYIAGTAKKQNKQQNNADSQRPQRPKMLKERANSRSSKQMHMYEKSDVIPPPAFTAISDAKTDIDVDVDVDDVKNEAHITQQRKRSKKRKLRRQLSLAKMQMSVLKAKLGLEQMKSPPVSVINEKEELEHANHCRSVSVSTENLFATIESMGSFERDIKDSIDRVDQIIHNSKQDDLQLIEENKQLKLQLTQIKEKLKSLQTENDKLKNQNQTKTQNKTQTQAQIIEFQVNPLEKYNKMKDLGMPIEAIADKMSKANIEMKEIEKWKAKHLSQSADQVLASKVNAKEQLYDKYDKMRKLGLSDDVLRNKMKMDSFKPDEIEKYLKPQTQTKPKADMAKYDRMKKMGMPQQVIRNKMKLDGISTTEQDTYFNPNSESDDKKEEKEKEKAKASKELAKYHRMKKMGMPIHAIVNKMRLDGMSPRQISEFENPDSKKKGAKKTIAATDPQLAKYERMKKMGMPMHAIINKMRLDGIESSLMHKFEHHQDDDNEDENESDNDNDNEADKDPNEANAINLNIPALAKYNRMKKMGMPTHAIVNKMKLDGIDAAIIDAFENPEKTKKKKRGLGGIFHKRKSSIPPKEKIAPSVDMKRFHWQTVDYKAARNSIWKTMDEKEVTHNIDKSEFEALFRIPKKENKLAKLFGKKEEKKEKEKKEEIKFVSAKRQYNVELLLKRLKLSGQQLCSNIIEMNEQTLNLDLLIKVSDMIPNDEEQMQAIAHSHNHSAKTIAKYGIVERFFYDLSSIWSLQERVKLWIFKKEFAEICQHQLDKISLLNKGLSDIQGSEGLYEIFKIILAFGNYMNGGRRNGAAYGFSLETLRMISGTKGCDGQTTLLMYVFKYTLTNIENDSVASAYNVAKQLENVSAAVRIDIDSLDKKIKQIEVELKKLPKRLKEFDKQTKKMKKDVYASNMSAWMKTANNILMELQKEFSEMIARAKMLASTYAYKLEDGAVHEFLQIFDDFIKDWNKAKIKHTKLAEKKKKDAKRAKKKLEAQKKLQLKLSQRTTTRQQLANKNILKDADKVKKEQALKKKLKLSMKAHVRKQTVMKQMFSDVLNQSDEEEDVDEDKQNEADSPYKDYMKSYQHDANANAKNRNVNTHFSPDENHNDNDDDGDNDEDNDNKNSVDNDNKKKNKNKKKKKKNEHSYRGKGGVVKRQDSNQKYDYAASGGMFQKRKAVPTASQFGNVWELNFTPMSRMAYSNSNSNKKKAVKYKSGHVRRETRLKKAFESMKNADLKDLDIEQTQTEKQTQRKVKTPKSNKHKKTKIKSSKGKNSPSVSSPKSKGTAIYSKYKNKNRTFGAGNNPNNTMEF